MPCAGTERGIRIERPQQRGGIEQDRHSLTPIDQVHLSGVTQRTQGRQQAWPLECRACDAPSALPLGADEPALRSMYFPVDRKSLPRGGNHYFSRLRSGVLRLGYLNLSGADFGIKYKDNTRSWAPDRITLHEIRGNVGDFLSDQREQYDFIHMSHVIEHIQSIRCSGWWTDFIGR